MRTISLVKINPLINWTEKEVWDYIKKEKIPYNLCTTGDFPVLAVNPAPGPSNQVKIYVPAAGGGKMSFTRSAACTKGS